MTLLETRYGVWLYGHRIGTIRQRGDHTRFTFTESYREDPDRPVLGLRFEQDLNARHAAALRLPPWFSNLLPEGPLRDWVAADRGVSMDREMELLAQVGHDLPGAVQVLPADEKPGLGDWDARNGHDESTPQPRSVPAGWRFSLAGVALKFSMVSEGDRLTLPAYGEGGDWIVKLPDRTYPEVPTNEFAMMSLAAASGIEVPPIRLVHRDQLAGLPSNVWPSTESWAYAVRRFDRADRRQLVHIEDLAQVRSFYPEHKYAGTYETVAGLVYRGRDIVALQEFARRLAFMVLISSGDAHLKNWSLIYRNRRAPTLSPVYDLVATAPYRGDREGQETLALKFGGSRRIDTVTVDTFTSLERRLRAEGAHLAEIVTQHVRSVEEHWPLATELLASMPTVRDGVAESIRSHSRSLLGSVASPSAYPGA